MEIHKLIKVKFNFFLQITWSNIKFDWNVKELCILCRELFSVLTFNEYVKETVD